MADNKKYKVGITAKESWAADISFELLDYTLWRVQDGGDGCGYIALKDNIGVRPDSDRTVWIPAVERGQSIYDYCIEYGLFEGTEEEFAQTYTDAVNAASRAAEETDATNTRVQAAEAEREAAEQERSSAEEAREAAETARQTAETERNSAETARSSAEAARASAESDRSTAEQQRSVAEGERRTAETSRETAEQARVRETAAAITDVNIARDQADAAAARANEAAESAKTMNEHPPRINETTLRWEIWDAATEQYVDTGVMATASPYATFEINPETGNLEESVDATYAGPEFSLEEGNLVITI